MIVIISHPPNSILFFIIMLYSNILVLEGDAERWVSYIESVTNIGRGQTIRDEKEAKAVSKDRRMSSSDGGDNKKVSKKVVKGAEQAGKMVIKKLISLEFERFKKTGILDFEKKVSE